MASRVDIHGNPVEVVDGVVGSSGSHKDSGKYGYYRVASNGYITTGPVWAAEKDRREEKGDELLRKYGYFQQESNTSDRYRRILSAGGAKEFCLEQILELGWHRKPPKGVKFPQLDGVDPIDHKCKYCGKLLLGCRVNEEGELVEDETNRRRHESIAHKDIASQEQLGRTLATALSQLQGGGGGSGNAGNEQSAAVLAMLTKMVSDMQERQKDTDKLIAELTAQVANQPSGDLPAVESGPRTIAGKKGKGKTK